MDPTDQSYDHLTVYRKAEYCIYRIDCFWYGNHPDFYDLPYYQRHPCQRYRSNLVWCKRRGRADILRGSSYLHRSFHDRSLSAGWNRSCSDVRSTASSDRTERAADEQDQKENRKNGTKQSNVCHPGILWIIWNPAQLFFKYAFLYPYRCIRSQPRFHHGGCTDACRCRKRAY